jgi:hypothetical protein
MVGHSLATPSNFNFMKRGFSRGRNDLRDPHNTSLEMPRRKAVPVKLEALLAEVPEASHEEEVEQLEDKSLEETLAELAEQTHSGELFPLVREHPLQKELLLLTCTGGVILGMYLMIFLFWLAQ